MLPEAQKEILFCWQDLRQLGKTENRINMGPGVVGDTTWTSGKRAGFPTGRTGNGCRQALMEVTFCSISFPSLTTEAGNSSKG